MLVDARPPADAALRLERAADREARARLIEHDRDDNRAPMMIHS